MNWDFSLDNFQLTQPLPLGKGKDTPGRVLWRAETSPWGAALFRHGAYSSEGWQRGIFSVNYFHRLLSASDHPLLCLWFSFSEANCNWQVSCSTVMSSFILWAWLCRAVSSVPCRTDFQGDPFQAGQALDASSNNAQDHSKKSIHGKEAELHSQAAGKTSHLLTGQRSREKKIIFKNTSLVWLFPSLAKSSKAGRRWLFSWSAWGFTYPRHLWKSHSSLSFGVSSHSCGCLSIYRSPSFGVKFSPSMKMIQDYTQQEMPSGGKKAQIH